MQNDDAAANEEEINHQKTNGSPPTAASEKTKQNGDKTRAASTVGFNEATT